MSKTVVLYHTLGCHLCEKAKDLLWPFLSHELLLSEIDIAVSDELIERYGTKIPVLRLAEGEELCWPFDKISLARFLENH